MLPDTGTVRDFLHSNREFSCICINGELLEADDINILENRMKPLFLFHSTYWIVKGRIKKNVVFPLNAYFYRITT